MRCLPLLWVLAACKPAGAPARAPGELRAGDAYLVDDGFGAERFIVERVAGDRVTGTLFGRERLHSRSELIRVSELEVGCPRPGTMTLVKTTDALWDLGLSLGSDGERCYLQESERTSQRSLDEVFAVPEPHAQRFARRRGWLEQARDAWHFIVVRPKKWRPAVGMEVVLRTEATFRGATVTAVRPAAVKVVRMGAFATDRIDEWRQLGAVAPPPSAGEPKAVAGDVVAILDAEGLRRVTAADAEGIDLEEAYDPKLPKRAAHGTYVLLKPAPEVELPPVSFAAADPLERALLLRDALSALGAIHSRRPKERPGVLLHVRPDGTPVAEMEYAIALAPDGEGDFSAGWALNAPSGPVVERPARWAGPSRVIAHGRVLDLAAELVKATAATAYVTANREVLVVRNVRILIFPAERRALPLSTADRRVLEELDSMMPRPIVE